MILVHIEIVAREQVPIHACIDRDQAYVILRIFSKLDQHLQAARSGRLYGSIVPVLASTNHGVIRSVIASRCPDASVEDELERRVGPRLIRVLIEVQISPQPSRRVLRHVFCEPIMSLYKRHGHTVSTKVSSFVALVSAFTYGLEV